MRKMPRPDLLPTDRDWEPGDCLVSVYSPVHKCKLLAPTWSGFAWVIWDGEGTPHTVRTCTVQPTNLQELKDAGRDYVLKAQGHVK